MEEAGKLCFYCAALHFADTVFLRLKTCGSSTLRKSIVKTFSNSLLPGSVLHFGNSHSVSIFDCYQYSSYGDL